MKKHLIPVLALAFLLLALPACDDHTAGGLNDNRSTGATSEILVVTQNEDQWLGIIGDTIRSFFLQPQYGLPQLEAMNKLVHINRKGFSDMFRKHKCILIAEIDPKLTRPIAESSRNSWSSPQMVIKIKAPDRASWCQKFEEQKETYKVYFDQVECERMLSTLRSAKDGKVSQRVKDKMGFDMVIPSGFVISKDEPDFMWIRNETDKSSYCLFIYTTPYRDKAQFDREHLITVRDRMLKNYVPGPSEGSFMTTEKEFVPPILQNIPNFPAGFAVEMRGMWCLVGDFMAGPFVSYTFADEHTGNLVTVEGYVYYPNHDKRDDLLELQSLIYSIKMPK